MKKLLFIQFALVSTVFLAGCDLTGEIELKQQTSGLLEQVSGTNNQISDLNKQPQEFNGESSISKNRYSGDLALYSDKQLGIQFTYPSRFGKITKDFEFGDDFITTGFIILLVGNPEDSKILFAFANGEPPIGRGAFWGDEARELMTKESIDNVCKKKSKLGSCISLTSAHNITYIKNTQKEIELGQEDGPTINLYSLYNPDSNFHGIIMSNERLLEEKEYLFDDIINSIEFIK